MISVSKNDEVYLILKGDFSSLEYEQDLKNLSKIDKYFSAYADDFQHNYAYLSGKWDGMIHFLKKVPQYSGVYIFPIGLFNELKTYADINSIPLDIKFKDDDIYTNDVVNWEELNKVLNTPSYFEDRQYQKDYVDAFFRTGRGCIISPTGSGKSSIIYKIVQNLIHFCLDPDEKILIVVPTVDLIKQMYDEFIENGFQNINEYVYMLSSGIEKKFEKRITISTWQSLQNLPPEVFSVFSALIVDECHTVSSSAEKLSYIAHNCLNARYRLGTTGTVPDKRLNEMTMVSYLGSTMQFISTHQLIEQGYLTQLVIKSTVLKWIHKDYEISDFQKEYELIVSCKERNRILLDTCYELYKRNPDTSIIVLGRRTEHLKELYETLKEKKPDIKCYLVTGKDTKKKERNNIYDELRGDGGIFFATEKIAGTGLNIKNISNVVLSTPLKSKITILQAIGRGVRKHDKKKFLEIYDFIDKIPIGKKKVNSTYKWVQNKADIYSNECFSNVFYNLNMKISDD
jgi:superfamily II DNA or RNA helicase